MGERQRISSGGLWEESVGYSRAVRVGDHVWVAGTTAAGPDGAPVGGDDAYQQTREALRRIVSALGEVGASSADVVRTRIYTTDIAHWALIGRAHGEVFADVRPVATMVQVAALIDRRLLVEIEAEAMLSTPKEARHG
jgi:enamine deaminase RidA (YjgF/YER057c/UK114 family)